jgi:hypothetical protein
LYCLIILKANIVGGNIAMNDAMFVQIVKSLGQLKSALKFDVPGILGTTARVLFPPLETVRKSLLQSVCNQKELVHTARVRQRHLMRFETDSS